MRLTGGEPLLRSDICEIISYAKSVDQIRDLSLTTNGYRLEEMAGDLKKSGLERINISLDSLHKNRLKEITGVDCFNKIWNGIKQCLDTEIKIKINTVIIRNFNDDEILPFLKLAEELKCNVRFIEFMPTCGKNWRSDLVVPMNEIFDKVKTFVDLEFCNDQSEVADTYKIKGSDSFVSTISPLTKPFCSACNRIRITANAKLRPCLLSLVEYDLIDVLKTNDIDQISYEIYKATQLKPPSHGLTLSEDYLINHDMKRIGG